MAMKKCIVGCNEQVKGGGDRGRSLFHDWFSWLYCTGNNEEVDAQRQTY